MKVRFTKAAAFDMDDIYRDIGEKNLQAAQRIEDFIREGVERLAKFPGARRPDLKDVRRLPLVRYPYTLFYRIVDVEDVVDILRVVHSASITNLRRLP